MIVKVLIDKEVYIMSERRYREVTVTSGDHTYTTRDTMVNYLTENGYFYARASRVWREFEFADSIIASIDNEADRGRLWLLTRYIHEHNYICKKNRGGRYRPMVAYEICETLGLSLRTR